MIAPRANHPRGELMPGAHAVNLLRAIQEGGKITGIEAVTSRGGIDHRFRRREVRHVGTGDKGRHRSPHAAFDRDTVPFPASETLDHGGFGLNTRYGHFVIYRGKGDVRKVPHTVHAGARGGGIFPQRRPEIRIKGDLCSVRLAIRPACRTGGIAPPVSGSPA